MATEGPLVHDGAQTTAFANYSTSGTSLLGVGGSAQFLAVSIQAARVVQITPNQTTAVYGILQNTPFAGEAADVGILGLTKAVAGSAITAGQWLMCGTGGTLGQVIPWATSSYRIGMAVEAASGQGVVFLIALGFGAQVLI